MKNAPADLAALLAAYKGPVTKVAAAPMDAKLSASRVVADAKPVTAHVTPSAQRVRAPRRNWEAQRRYDEAHGTENGYDPKIRDWQEMHDREMEG